VLVDVRDHTAPGEDENSAAALEKARLCSVKSAILQAVGHQDPPADLLEMVQVKLLDHRRASIKTIGSLRKEIWDRRIITFRTTMTQLGSTISCTALAIADARDALR
jgi:hypothetical protein